MVPFLIILGVLVVIGIFIAGVYNSLIGLRNRVKDQWAQIDVQLKRRFDLIPNLVETVKGYAKHESETLEKVVAARNTFLDAKTPEEEMKADGELSNAIGRLFAISEAYPDLKANANFTSLQTELSQTEDKISYARQFYNDDILKYNNKIEMFPGNIVAKMFGFKLGTYFEINDKEKENIQVKF